MFVNTELLELIRLKNPLSSVIGKYEVITDACCKCPLCHSKTNSLNLFHDEIYTCFHCGESGDVFGFVSKIENLSFAKTVRKMTKSSGIYTLEELKREEYLSLLGQISDSVRALSHCSRQHIAGIFFGADKGISSRSEIQQSGAGYRPAGKHHADEIRHIKGILERCS